MTKDRNKIDVADLVNLDDAARLVSVSRKTVENWLSLGALTRFKVGPGQRCRTLISKTELVGLIRKVKVPA